jgi:hypothetical protein
MSPAAAVDAVLQRRSGIRSRLAGEIAGAPLAYAYLGVLCLTTLALAGAGKRFADRMLLAESTNLRHLAHDPLRVLVGSAFWLSGPHDLLVAAAAIVAVLARVERRIGMRRTAAIFVVGHLGATLAIAAGLWLALRLDAVERSVVNAQDVGASYGLLAVAAAGVYLLPRALRGWYAAALLGVVVGLVTLSTSFTNFGHVAAVLLGFASARLVRVPTPPPVAVPPPSRRVRGDGGLDA